MKNYFIGEGAIKPVSLKPVYLAVYLALGFLPTIANAEEAEETLPEVSVEASAEATASNTTEDYVASEARTATKTDGLLIESPQSISVITEQQIIDQGGQTLQDMVRYSAGVTSEAYGLDNRGDWLFIRGTEHTEYRDGLRVQSQTYHLPRPHAYALDRVEVLRGPSSVLYGASTVGGNVNLISKRPQTKAEREINVQYGMYDHKQVGIDLTGPLNDDPTMLYRIVAMGMDSGSQVDHTDMQNWFIAPSFTFKPSDQTSLTILANIQRDETDGATAAFPPHSGTILRNPNGRLPTQLFTGEPGYDKFDMDYNALGWEFSHAFNDTWTIRQNARISNSQLDYASIYPSVFGGIGTNPFIDANQRLVTRQSFANEQETDVLVVDNQLQSKWNLGATHHTVLFGVDYMKVRQDNRDGFLNSPTPFDLFDPVYGNVPASELAVAVDQLDQYVTQLGFYLQDQIRFGQWTVTAGIRNDAVKNKVQAGDEQKDTSFTSRIGVVYLAENGLAPYASYSESFNPEVGLDANNQTFDPKRGKQVEAGLRYQPPGSNSMYTISVYELEENNRLTFDPNTNSSVQTGGVKSKGVELDVAANLTSKVDLLANYTYTHVRAKDGLGGDETYIAEVHPHVASLWATYKFSVGEYDGFKVGGGVRYIGNNQDETGTLDIPSVTLFDAMLSYDTNDWRAALNASNITDETYVASCLSRGDCWYGSRANVIGSLTYKF